MSTMREQSCSNPPRCRSRCHASIAQVMRLQRLLRLVVVIALQTTSMECRPVIDRTTLSSMAGIETSVYQNGRNSNGTEDDNIYWKWSEHEVDDFPQYQKKLSIDGTDYDQDAFKSLLDKINDNPLQSAETSSLYDYEVDSRRETNASVPSQIDCDIRYRPNYPERLEHRLPKAIIVGVKKGGTRALLEFLRVHPDVRAPGPEVHFFDRNYHKGLDWYRSRMPVTSPCHVTVEKTPSYFVTRGVASRVYNMSRDTRLIVVVRDPVTRAVSDYVQAVAKRPDLGSFELRAFVGVNGNHTRPSNDVEEIARPKTTSRAVASSWGPIRIGLYARHLRQWLEYFPREQIHFVSGERLVDSPADELRRVEKFLGLRPFIKQHHFYYNTTKGFPCLQLLQHSADFAGGGVGSSATSRTSYHGDVAENGNSVPITRCLGKNKGRTHPNIDAAVLQRLRQFYRPHNELFYRLAGIDFGWL